MGTELQSWQVRALFLGAQASTNVRLGPRDLLKYIRGPEPVRGKDLNDANLNLQSLVTLWNRLAEDHRLGCVQLSHVSASEQSTLKDLVAIAQRRNEEINWFIQGLDAGGGDPSELGTTGQQLFARLVKTSRLLESYCELLGRTSESDARKAQRSLRRLTIGIETILDGLLSVSHIVRARMRIAEQRKSRHNAASTASK